MTSDGELLRRYAETASEEAFGELVRRHLDLVYSAALRMVNRDAHLAQDVAQSVFTDLARKARRLTERADLAGWLYTSAHHAAANAVRAERRRQTREQKAHTMQELRRDPEASPDWEMLRPVLDAALLELGESDREAVLLRYFQNRPYADIGKTIGLGENAARMRVERALEKLHSVLSRRGMTATVALAAALSANAVTAAPSGLAAAIISTAARAGTAAATATIASSTKAIAMTTIQKTLIAAVLVAAIGGAIYGTNQASQLREQNLALELHQASLSAQIETLQGLQSDASNRLAALAWENQRLLSTQKTAEVMKLRGKLAALKQALANEAASNQPSTGLAKMMSDPAMKESSSTRQSSWSRIKERYAPFAQGT